MEKSAIKYGKKTFTIQYAQYSIVKDEIKKKPTVQYSMYSTIQ